jgi:hypothetical protein
MQIILTKPLMVENETGIRYQAEEINLSLNFDELTQLTGPQCPAKQRFSIVNLSGSEIGKKAAQFLKNLIASNPEVKDKLDPQVQQIIDKLSEFDPEKGAEAVSDNSQNQE